LNHHKNHNSAAAVGCEIGNSTSEKETEETTAAAADSWLDEEIDIPPHPITPKVQEMVKELAVDVLWVSTVFFVGVIDMAVVL
jgi:hypothetical protein